MSGEVPEGWTRTTLGALADITRGVSWREENETNETTVGALPVLGIRNVQQSLKLDETVWLGGLSQKAVASSTVRFGDILMVGSNGNPARIGNAVRINVPGVYLYASFLFGVRPDEAQVDGEFLFQMIRSSAVQQAISDTVQGSTGLANLKITVLRDISLLLPPLDEQQRIAEMLRSVDDAIKKAELVASGAKSARMALLADLFHQADWEPQRALPSGWQAPLLDAVAKRGSGHTPNKQFPTYWDGDVKWISLQDTKRLDRVYIADTAATITPEGLANSSAMLHPANTVVVSRDATVGRSAIMMSDMAVSQHFISYTCGPTLSPLYLYYWLQRMKPVFERIGAGSTIKTIGLPFFKGLKIAIPDRAEQDRAAELLWRTDNQIFASEEAINKLRSVKAAVSADLFFGRVRVPA